MKRGSTLFLKGVIALIALMVLAICVFILPVGIREDDVIGYRPILFGLYVAAIPFYGALYQAFKILNYIDDNKAFSNLSVRALKNIKYSAIAISAMFTAGLPYIYIVAERDDAPGVILIGMVIAFASFIIATFAGVLQTLLRSAAAIKSENDLTV